MARTLYLVNRPGLLTVTMQYGGKRAHPVVCEDVGTISINVNGS